MIEWHLDPAYRDSEIGRRCGSLAEAFAVQGEQITRDKVSEVLRIEIGGQGYYIKRYLGRGVQLRRLLGRARAASEWTNLMRFARWNIPAPVVVAHGQERRFGLFMRGALITEELPDTIDMARLARQDSALLRDRHWFKALSAKVAAIVRTLHRHRFTHNDLHWRNLLFQPSTGTVFLIDCPNGTFWRGPLLEYRIIKDLASLDKLARVHLARTQRLRFYLDYVGKRTLDARDKDTIRKILQAHHRRLQRKGRAP